MNPGDIVSILTAAAPIVASIASGVNANNNRPAETQRGNTERTINVTINNNFYTSESDAYRTASQIQNQVVGSIYDSVSRRYDL